MVALGWELRNSGFRLVLGFGLGFGLRLGLGLGLGLVLGLRLGKVLVLGLWSSRDDLDDHFRLLQPINLNLELLGITLLDHESRVSERRQMGFIILVLVAEESCPCYSMKLSDTF